MTKTHYEIFGYKYNPAKDDPSFDLDNMTFEAEHKMMGKNKREALGAVKIFLDNYDCEHIAIFRINGDD